jgi:hypothetical protein
MGDYKDTNLIAGGSWTPILPANQLFSTYSAGGEVLSAQWVIAGYYITVDGTNVSLIKDIEGAEVQAKMNSASSVIAPLYRYHTDITDIQANEAIILLLVKKGRG